MVMDDELACELTEFLDDTLLSIFAEDQGLTMEWRVERLTHGHCCIIKLDGEEMPAAIGRDDQGALDNASVQAIELLTRRARQDEPELAFA